MKLSVQFSYGGGDKYFLADLPDKLKQAASTGLRKGAREVARSARQEMDRAFSVSKRGFANSVTAGPLPDKPGRPPAVLIGSRIPWLGIHETGGSIQGPLLIPLVNTRAGRTRIGRQRFALIIERLNSAGAIHWVKQPNGNVLLMAENIPSLDGVLGPFKSTVRNESGAKRLKRSQDIPVAILIRNAKMKKRLNLRARIAAELPRITAAIEAEIGRL